MAIDDFRVPGAKANPIQKSKLPAGRRELLFPVRTHTVASDRQHTHDVLACLVSCSFWIVIVVDDLIPWTQDIFRYLPWLLMLAFLGRAFLVGNDAVGAKRWSGILLIMFCVVGGIFYPILNPFGPSLWLMAAMLVLAFLLTNHHDPDPSRFSDAMASYTLPIGGVALAMIAAIDMLALGKNLPLLCVVLLVLQGLAFRRHTIERSVVGMLDKKTIRDFRVWKRIPRGLTSKPRITGLLAAVRCYLSYNRAGVAVPGSFRSPAGSIRTRLAMSVTAICSLSMFLYFALGREVGSIAAKYSSSLETLTIANTLFIAACPVAAVAVWYATLFAFTWRFIGRALALKNKQISPSHWRRMLDRLDHSANTHERESLWIGTVSYDQSPILYPTSKLFTHSWVVGSSGSGKTAWIMALVDQIIYRTDIQVIVVDCKAHNSELLPVMQRAADARTQNTGIRVPVKYFTLKEGRATFLLDMFSQTWWKNLPTPQRTGTILSALSLNYATVYGASYFRDAAYEFTAFVLDRNPNVTSWGELVTRMQDAIRFAKEPWELSKRCKEDGEHIVWIVKRLASLSALNNQSGLPQSVRDNAIDFSNGHYYFALNARENGLITGEVGRLITACVLASSYAKTGRRTLLVLDEWQLMVTRELEELLTQARDLGVGCVLANQNAAQLKTSDVDLIPIVEGNTSLQAWMKVTDVVGREQLRRLGGQEVDVLVIKRHTRGEEPSYSFSETLQDRVNSNLVSEISSDSSQFLLRLTDNAGLACYGDLVFAAKSMFNQTASQYKAACSAPWPTPTIETLVNQNAVPQYKPTGTNRNQNITPRPRAGNRLGQSTNP